ncbi:sulfate/molybdate ABC transporter ATP-binding protein [Aeromicrobium duanguangcaii]|uniref:sulfate/molybdate ABC transporter ATP-binding protein n=1 Tax=Aeromicrobium duanguangcaii TaxID=2968086 RepID=UPI002017AF8A|nr:ABC transporter ATP-binding protein [Aeromicrobium duanguangcaii]MCL3837480.1 ABC transporter ATP-binding protein [Aeromicrobium duanguangcaii]
MEVEVADGETLAVLGPNGAGKSSLLAAIAGLWRPAEGQVTVGERVLVADGVWVPPHRRSVALLGQEARLFPHLTVRENVAFGPRSQGRSDATRVGDQWLEQVGGSALAERRPRELSGGQAQRVAIARALAVEPDVVLLDEPLAALDVEAVPELRRLLRVILARTTTVLVTHDPLDALSLADRAVVVEAGRIVHEGPARDVLLHPRSAFGAALAGVNLVEGVATGVDTVRANDGRELTGIAARPLSAGAGATATFAPTAVALHREQPAGSPRNVLRGTVGAIESRGATCRVEIEGWIADVTTAAAAELRLEPGDDLWLSIKATEVRLEPV